MEEPFKDEFYKDCMSQDIMVASLFKRKRLKK